MQQISGPYVAIHIQIHELFRVVFSIDSRSIKSNASAN